MRRGGLAPVGSGGGGPPIVPVHPVSLTTGSTSTSTTSPSSHAVASASAVHHASSDVRLDVDVAAEGLSVRSTQQQQQQQQQHVPREQKLGRRVGIRKNIAAAFSDFAGNAVRYGTLNSSKHHGAPHSSSNSPSLRPLVFIAIVAVIGVLLLSSLRGDLSLSRPGSQREELLARQASKTSPLRRGGDDAFYRQSSKNPQPRVYPRTEPLKRVTGAFNGPADPQTPATPANPATPLKDRSGSAEADLDSASSFPPRVGHWIPPEVRGRGLKWINVPGGKYRSTPYLPVTEAHTTDLLPQFLTPGSPGSVPLPGEGVKREVERIVAKLRAAKHDKLARMFAKCFPNTLETTVKQLATGGSYVITGDIDLMWLRDSSAQVHQYLSLHEDPTIRVVVEGLIQQQMFFIPYNPYGSSFRVALRPEDDLGDFHVGKARNFFTSMHNFELDSLCYPVWLSYQWWKASGRSEIFTQRWREVAWLMMDLFAREQRHFLQGSRGDCTEEPPSSCYRYVELPRDIGPRVNYTGMIWTGFRPSDDQTQYGYLIPSNMFAVVILGQLVEIARGPLNDLALAARAEELRLEIDRAIHKFGVVDHPTFGRIYAYEVDGFGKNNLMDDANVPSLLSIPYLEYKSPTGMDSDFQIAENTRKFVLSTDNPFFFSGKLAQGVGSPHTSSGFVWHMAIVMRGLTSRNDNELHDVFQQLVATDADTLFMHESFHPDRPSQYSRSWFAWANSLFSELIVKELDWLENNPGNGKSA